LPADSEEGGKMTIDVAKDKVLNFLIEEGLDSEAPTYRALIYIFMVLDALQEQVNNLEDIDEKAGQYRDLLEEAINEFQAHLDSRSTIDYGTADKLRNKLEEIKGHAIT
jgi:hypothetical protein